MVAQLVADLQLPIAQVRLESYRPANGTDEQMLSNYLWNVALCEALYPSLNMLEVSLRNAVHAAVTTQFGSNFWFDLPNLLKRWQPGEIVEARSSITKRGKTATADRIVAELKCGFWTTILSRDYHNDVWNLNNAAPLAAAFPNVRGSLFQRHLIHSRFNDLRIFRNRVFHFEPIWNHPNLTGKHSQILEAIGWISPAAVGTLSLIDRFPIVYQRGLPETWALIMGYAATRAR
jgi:hypothetical protein